MNKPINQPIHTSYNGIIYDSIFEARIAETLQPYVYHGCGIQQQVKLLVKSGTPTFKDRFWNCDFCISDANDNLLFIEAKGFPDKTFRTTIELLDYFNPLAFNNLLIVVPESFKAPKAWEPFRVKLVKEKYLIDKVNNWLKTKQGKPP
jgi:hypothetical protein